MRFFFHLQDGTTFLDDEGTELPDPDAARQEAMRACGEMLRDAPRPIKQNEVFRLWVTDQPQGQGQTLFVLTVAAQNA